MAFNILQIITDGNYLTQPDKPRLIPLYTDNIYSFITTAGYLNTLTIGSSAKIEIGDVINACYSDGSTGFLNALLVPSFDSDGVITLAPIPAAGITSSSNGNLVSFSASGQLTDSGILATSVLISTSTVTDYQQFITINDVLSISAGTWTKTRVATGSYSYVHTPGDDTSILGIDITPQLRAAASLGFKLASIDVISSIATLALDAHSATLSSVVYANNVAVAVTSVPLTGTLPTATQANPYVTNLAVTTPAFLNTAVAKYSFELTVNAAATSVYSFYGINLHFTKSVA